MSSIVPASRGRWLMHLRAADPINIYIGLTAVGIVWVLGVARLFYFNPLTNDQTTLWQMWSFEFVRPWMMKHPVDAPKMRLAVLPTEKIAPGGTPRMARFRQRFCKQWEACGGSSSRAIFRLMLPWWTFTHVVQIPRKFVQFLPPLLVKHLLEFLQDPQVPVLVGYKLMLLAALRMICDKSAQALYLFSASNAGTQPALFGCQTMILEKLQTISPRARVSISAAEIQTVFAKMERFTAALTAPGQARLLIDYATLPLGYFFLYRLFGLPAIVVSIGANVGISALSGKVGKQKTVSEEKLRDLRKKQEGILNDLSANLPIWKLYGWTDFFIDKLNDLTVELETVGRWNAMWKTLTEVLPSSVGPTAVLISVGINILLGGKLQLVKLLTAGSYISIITFSMQSITEARQQWRDLCVECKNIDAVLALPDATPPHHTADGSIQLTNASFGWPMKPPAKYKVKTDGTSCSSVTEGDTADVVLLRAGDLVVGVDGQTKGRDQVRVKSMDGVNDGYVKVAALEKLPEPSIKDWTAPSPAITQCDLHIEKGELVLVSGPVAGGKSTLLQSLVGNTEQLTGHLAVPHSVAFQPQSPILFDQTIRSNILFGIDEEDANEAWVQQSLEASTLSLDMDDKESTLHAKRELTSAGQKGSELSGGQQARVALARCIYAALAGSECLILDDPIKALDPATAARCWEDGIKTAMAGKTRVVVVNSQMLQRFASDSAVTRLVIIEGGGTAGSVGRITYNGSPAGMPRTIQERLGEGYCMTSSPAAAQGITHILPVDKSVRTQAPASETNTTSSTTKSHLDASMVEFYSQRGQEYALVEWYNADNGRGVTKKTQENAFDAGNKKAKGENSSTERAKQKKAKKNKGSIPGSVIAYCRRMGLWIVVSAAGMMATQAAGLGLYAWYEHWAKDTFKFGFARNYAIAIFAMLGAQATRLLQGVTDGIGGEGASKSIRLDINTKLRKLGMPYLWDPEHSTAQMVDLVTKDPNEYRLFAMMPLLLSSAAFSLGAVLYAKPIITPLAMVCLVCYKYVKKPFGWGIRQVYGGLILEAWVAMRKFSGEMFDGASTIVAMGRQAEFNAMINSRYFTRLQLSPLYFGSIGRSNFYGMLVDTVWATISMAVVIQMRGQMAPAVAIAVFNQLEELNSVIGNFFTYNDAAAQTLPNWMKVQEFLQVTSCVGKSCIEDDRQLPPLDWPKDGSIAFDDVFFDYCDGAPCALNGISCTIESGQKIGVCGRTGAGKSTLLSVLFSLGPLKSGAVSIGGKDLAGISCHAVRSNLAIVPQSPTLFDGTVRENLVGGNRQPAGESCSDEYLLQTLVTCRLSDLAKRGLDGTMGQLSDGQRQLFCVARALVRRPKILVLDESTADLDQDSANELLRVIDENFTHTTVISIAHRLNFIRNSDKILVLNTGGTINAFDTPENLLMDTDGYFARQMVEENTGM